MIFFGGGGGGGGRGFVFVLFTDFVAVQSDGVDGRVKLDDELPVEAS